MQIQAIGTVEAYTRGVGQGPGRRRADARAHQGRPGRAQGRSAVHIDPRTLRGGAGPGPGEPRQGPVQVQQARAVLQRDHARVEPGARRTSPATRPRPRNAEIQEQALRRAAQEGADLPRAARPDADHVAGRSRPPLQADEADVRSAEETVRADEAAIQSAEQTVRADEAAVENAKVQLGYTTIRSPIDGRAGSLGSTRATWCGQRHNDSTLLVINQVQPIYVSFTVPQQQLPRSSATWPRPRCRRTPCRPASPARPGRGDVHRQHRRRDHRHHPAQGDVRQPGAAAVAGPVRQRRADARRRSPTRS